MVISCGNKFICYQIVKKKRLICYVKKGLSSCRRRANDYSEDLKSFAKFVFLKYKKGIDNIKKTAEAAK